jgi:hypothetical protein
MLDRYKDRELHTPSYMTLYDSRCKVANNIYLKVMR